MEMKVVKVKVSRNETWYPEVRVPVYCETEEQIIAFLQEDDQSWVYDDYANRATYDADQWTEVLSEEAE